MKIPLVAEEEIPGINGIAAPVQDVVSLSCVDKNQLAYFIMGVQDPVDFGVIRPLQSGVEQRGLTVDIRDLGIHIHSSLRHSVISLPLLSQVLAKTARMRNIQIIDEYFVQIMARF